MVLCVSGDTKAFMVNRAKQDSVQKGRDYLLRGFQGVQEQLVLNLKQSQSTITHDGEMGAVNEAHWIDIFRAYLPKRYACESGIIIDSLGHTSDQIDIVIYDLQYTPTLLNQQLHRFIPIEAVYAVFEAKPRINKILLQYAADKASSVRSLHRTGVAIPDADGTYKKKLPFTVVAGVLAAQSDWKDGLGESFSKVIHGLKDSQRLDCGCALKHGAFDFFEGNVSRIVRNPDSTLIYFLFRLLKKLQSIGTVPAIDWDAYLTVFQPVERF